MVTTHEAANPADRLQQVMSLPLAATRLDTSLTAASNVEELLVASSGLSQSSFSRGTRSRSGTPGRGFNDRGRSPFKQKNTEAWINNKPFENGQMGPGKFSVSPSRQTNNYVKGQMYKGKPESNVRGSTPSRSYFRSPGGRYYREMSRSPARARSGSKNQRGRSKSPRQKVCLRCLSASHLAEQCPHYTYYNGAACEQCGGLYHTAAHKNNLSSRRLSGQRVTQTNNAEFEMAVENGGNGGQGQDQPNMFRTSGLNNIFGQQKNV